MEETTKNEGLKDRVTCVIAYVAHRYLLAT